MTLSTNQRWLLLHMGGWQIASALSSPDGVSYLMGTMWGSTGGRSHASDLPDAPAWLGGWDTRSNTITARHQGGPQVTVTAKEINEFAKQLDPVIKAEMVQCRNASSANAILTGRFCHCGSDPCGYAYMRDRICPPTEQQEADARAEYWRVRDWQDDLLARVLLSGAPGDQLDLFGAAS